MKLSGNTLLITGGTSGIGFELAKQLLARGNTVIVTGRDEGKLAAAKRSLPGLHIIRSDVSDPADIVRLHREVTTSFPALDVLVNNAGVMRKLDLQDGANDPSNIAREIETNLIGPVRMVQQFLPHLKSRASAAIVNVSSGLAFVPMAIAPVYCATKAGLHSYTQSLRLQLRGTPVAVFELAPPATDTPLLGGDFTREDIGGLKGMDVALLARRAIEGIERGTVEIRPGLSKLLYLLGRFAPTFGAAQLGKSVKRMRGAAGAGAIRGRA